MPRLSKCPSGAESCPQLDTQELRAMTLITVFADIATASPGLLARALARGARCQRRSHKARRLTAPTMREAGRCVTSHRAESLPSYVQSNKLSTRMRNLPIFRDISLQCCFPLTLAAQARSA
eukprot:4428965-Amphidinium_carterae.1